jgi:hypothetical protein
MDSSSLSFAGYIKGKKKINKLKGLNQVFLEIFNSQIRQDFKKKFQVSIHGSRRVIQRYRRIFIFIFSYFLVAKFGYIFLG